MQSLCFHAQIEKDSVEVYSFIQRVKKNEVTVAKKEKDFKRNYELTQAHRQPRWRYDILTAVADQYIADGNSESKELLIEAKSIAFTVEEVNVEKELLFKLGCIYEDTEGYLLAFENFELCEEYISQPGDPDYEDLLHHLVNSSYYSGQIAVTKKYIDKCWERGEKGKESLLFFSYKWDLKLALDKDDYKEVIFYSDRIYPKLTSDVDKLNVHSYEIRAYTALGDYAKAKQVYFDAQKLIKDSDLDLNTFQIHMDMAICFHNNDQFLEMVVEYKNAKKSAETQEDFSQLYLFWCRSMYSLRDNDQDIFDEAIDDARQYNEEAYKYINKVDDETEKLELLYIYYENEYLLDVFQEKEQSAAFNNRKMSETRIALNNLQEEKRLEEAEMTRKLLDEEREVSTLEFKNESLRQRNKVLEAEANKRAAEAAESKARAEASEASAKANRREAEAAKARARQLEAEREEAEAKAQTAIANKNAARDSIAKVKAERDVLIAEDERRQAQAKEQEAEKKAEERREQIQNQRFAVLGMFLVVLLTTFFLWRIRKQRNMIRANKQIIEEEKKRSDDLLLSILPAKVADELKQTNQATPQHYDKVTVLFADFQSFTRLSESLQPTELLFLLNSFFHEFDEIAKEFGLERIKTIGDAYMAAGGLPVENHTNPLDTVKAALKMQEKLIEKRNELGIPQSNWQMRIGVHTGAVVAGVVGQTKFAYDIWGDAVNIASRLETNSEAGRVNISQQTYEEIKEVFHCEYRGEIEVKNRGIIDMYFVNELKV